MEVSGEESGKVDKLKLKATAHANNSDIFNKYYSHSSLAMNHLVPMATFATAGSMANGIVEGP